MTDQTPQERLEAKVAKWNEESRAKPGPKVRVYTAMPDGSIAVEDRERQQV